MRACVYMRAFVCIRVVGLCLALPTAYMLVDVSTDMLVAECFRIIGIYFSLAQWLLRASLQGQTAVSGVSWCAAGLDVHWFAGRRYDPS
jgi:hypothetical protein